jgi:two-component system, LytTR family, sensor kinase
MPALAMGRSGHYNGGVTQPVMGLIVDVLGFLTGIVLYLMLVVMVWHERAGEGKPFFDSRGRLPLLTGVCGVLWNTGALLSYGPRVIGGTHPHPALVAVAFSALGFLPAVVVHALLEGRETAAGQRFTRGVILIAYTLSGSAAIMHTVAAFRGDPVPARPALWLLTAGFTVVTALLLFVTRRQPIGRRGIWVAALALFAVSALHFIRHEGNEVWWVELIGHHASLLLALAILHQDYRFALADLFLKNAIALLLLMGASLALFLGVIVPLLRWQDPTGAWDLRAVALFVIVWMSTALLFPTLRRTANRLVDRVVLRRPDYDGLLRRLASGLEVAESESDVTAEVVRTLQDALGVTDARTTADPLPDDERRLVLTAADLRGRLPEPVPAALLRLRTVEQPHPALVFGPMSAGRRLLSDDVHMLQAVAQLALRRIDSLRVAQERLEGNLREQRMQQLTTEAELRALRARLNPHFLFNALTTVGYLIQTAPDRAVQTLLQLTSVLRSVLHRSAAEFSTLADEIELVRAYLEIEQARFEERLDVAVEVAAAAGRFSLPTLLLQPLVENAIKHGLAPKGTGGRVCVRAHTGDGRLHIVVEDSGVGFDPSNYRTDTGVGLASVAQRLAVHYGGKATLDIHSRPGEGTTVAITMPAELRPGRTLPFTRRKTG